MTSEPDRTPLPENDVEILDPDQDPTEGLQVWERPWPRPWMAIFLRSLATVPEIETARRIAGVAKSTLHEARKGRVLPDGTVKRAPYEGFDDAVDEALERAHGRVLFQAHQWIMTGVPVRSVKTTRRTRTIRTPDGNVVGEETQVDEMVTESADRSERLMHVWLRAFHPAIFDRPSRVEQSGPDGGPIRHELSQVESVDAAIAELTAKMRQREIAPPPVEDEA